VSGAERDWVRLAPPGFRVELSYPAVTPQGQVVDRTDERIEGHPVAGDFERIHLTSPGSEELYVELARFPGRLPEDEYRLHVPSLRQRFGDDSVTALRQVRMGEHLGWAYDFRWDGGERSVLLVQVAGDTYRIVYDPRSTLNPQVVGTLAIAD
jgi:hypothetical protein